MPSGSDDRTVPMEALDADFLSVETSGSTEAHTERVGQLFHRYHGKLVKFLAARTRSWDDAHELAAQTFEQVLAHAPSRQIEFPGAYLYRTARNLATDQLKHRAMQKRKAPVMRYDGDESGSSPEPDHVHAEQCQLLARAVGRLAPRLRMAVTLRIYDEASDSEIADHFAAQGVLLTDRTVRRYIASAYDQIRMDVLAAEKTRAESAA